MLDEIVFAVADMGAVDDITDPPFQLSMALVFVPDPIGFPLEGFGVRAGLEGADERLEIFTEMFRPVRWFETLLHLETERTLKLRR